MHLDTYGSGLFIVMSTGNTARFSIRLKKGLGLLSKLLSDSVGYGNTRLLARRRVDYYTSDVCNKKLKKYYKKLYKLKFC